MPSDDTPRPENAGGDTYHGSLYADLQDDAMQATNIDDAQIARGVSDGPGLDARDVNRLERFRDFTADVGGYLKRNKAWWYGAYRSSVVAQRYPWLLDTTATLTAKAGTGKVTYLLSSRQKLVGYVQHETFEQSNYFIAGTSQPIQTSDALPSIVFPVSLWKGEYNAALTDAIYLDARVGERRSQRRRQDGVETSLRTVLGLPRGSFYRGLQSEPAWLVADLPLDRRRKRERPLGQG